VLTGAKSSLDHGMMQRVRREDVDGVDGRIVEQSAVIAGGAFDSAGARKLARFLLARSGDR